MKAIIQVGYTQILLPNIEDAARVMKVLSKGTMVRERLYDRKIEIEDRSLDLELKAVPDDTIFYREGREGTAEAEVNVSAPGDAPRRRKLKAAPKRKALPAPNTLMLEFPKAS